MEKRKKNCKFPYFFPKSFIPNTGLEFPL